MVQISGVCLGHKINHSHNRLGKNKRKKKKKKEHFFFFFFSKELKNLKFLMG